MERAREINCPRFWEEGGLGFRIEQYPARKKNPEDDEEELQQVETLYRVWLSKQPLLQHEKISMEGVRSFVRRLSQVRKIKIGAIHFRAFVRGGGGGDLPGGDGSPQRN